MKMLGKMLVLTMIVALSAACGDSANGVDNDASGFETSAQVQAHLANKTFVMQGEDIPESPLGFDADMNLGANTQCFYSTTLEFTDTGVSVETQPGTLNDAPNQGDKGTCDTSTPAGSPLSFSSNNVSISNVENGGDCFDINIAYTGFTQEGRGSLRADGTVLDLELFGEGQVGAAQHRCETAGVGENDVTVTISGGATMEVPAGTAVQTYQLQAQ